MTAIPYDWNSKERLCHGVCRVSRMAQYAFRTAFFLRESLQDSAPQPRVAGIQPLLWDQLDATLLGYFFLSIIPWKSCLWTANPELVDDASLGHRSSPAGHLPKFIKSLQNLRDDAVMNLLGRHEADADMPMFFAIPREKGPDVGQGVFLSSCLPVNQSFQGSRDDISRS